VSSKGGRCLTDTTDAADMSVLSVGCRGLFPRLGNLRNPESAQTLTDTTAKPAVRPQRRNRSRIWVELK
jgi:hypothetical protein